MEVECFDVVVVGGGVMGSAAAAAAASAGKRTLLLEARAFLHRCGSSHGESRIIRRTYPSHMYVSIMARTYPMWRDVEEATGATLFTRTGGCDILRRDGAALKALLAACARGGVPVEVLPPAEVAARFGLTIDVRDVGVHQVDSGTLDATGAVAALQRLAAQRGATLCDHWEAVALTDVDGGVEVRARDGRVVRGRAVVVAPGPWAAPTLRALLGLALPVTVLQVTVAYFGPATTPDGPARLASMPVLIDYGDAASWTGGGDGAAAEEDAGAPDGARPLVFACPSRERPGTAKFGVHAGVATTADGRDFAPARVAQLQDWLRAHAPFVDASAPLSTESCLYTMTGDEDFVIAPAPGRPRVVVAAGFSGHGFKMAPWVGRVAVTLATGGPLDADDVAALHAFRLGREWQK